MMIRLFIKQVSLFLLILVGINFSLFFLIRGFYIKDYDEVDLGYSEYLLADSHGTPLGDFTEVHGVHNFSSQSDSYIDMERKLKFLVQNTTLKKIYLSVDDHTLSPLRDKQNNSDRSSYYAEEEDFVSYREYILEKYLKYYCVFLNDRYSLVIKNFIQNELFDFSKWGGVRSKSSWEDLSSLEQMEISGDRINHYFGYSSPSQKMRDSLQRIIAICKQNKIELIGLRFPLSKTYMGILKNESYDADSVFNNNDLPIVDFDSLFLEEDYMFRDMDHLDKAGGEKFAGILFNSLKAKPVL